MFNFHKQTMEFQKSLFLFFVFLACFLLSSSQAYKFYVGGRDGWVLNPKEPYNHWTARNRFQVNDTLYFKYKKGEDSVLVVKKDDYLKCKIENPIMKMEGGHSEFKFDRSGPFYFMTGNKDHCIKGQKLIVIVLAVRKTKPFPTPASKTLPPFAQPPTTVQSPSPVALPPSPTSPSPVPSPESPKFSPTPTYVTPVPSTASPVVAPVPAVSPAAPSAVTPTPAENTPPVAPSPSTLTPSLPPASNPQEGSQGNSSSPTASPASSTPANLTSPAPAPLKSSSFAVTTSSVILFVVTAVFVV